MIFRELKIGDVFHFDHTGTPFADSLKSGPFQKTSTWSYCWRERDGSILYTEVGTLHIKVIPTDENI